MASDFLDLELGECDPPDMGAGMNWLKVQRHSKCVLLKQKLTSGNKLSICECVSSMYQKEQDGMSLKSIGGKPCTTILVFV